MTAVVIVNWNAGSRLGECVQSVFQTAPNVEMVIVDNASSDGSLESIQEFRDRLHIVRNSANRGFAAAVNQGFAASSSPFVLVLNPDTRALPGSIARLVEILENNPKAAAVGGYVNEKYLPRRLPGASTFIRENLGFADRERLRSAGPAEQPAAAALLVRRDAYDEIGGFDERFFPAWYEDVDFCKRLNDSKWETHFAPDAKFEHEGGYTAAALGRRAFAAAYYGNQVRYAEKHFGAWSAFAVRLSIAAGRLLRAVIRK